MDVETAIQAFASVGHDPPQDAMQWALDHWDEVAPGLLNVLERFVSGADRSNDAASTVFLILHLAGEKQDTRVFPLLCRLAQDGEALEAALGDDIPPTLKRLLVRTYDGDLDTPNENRSGTPSTVRMPVGRFQTLPSFLLPRSRRSAGMVLARVAVAKSSRSAASSADLSGTFY